MTEHRGDGVGATPAILLQGMDGMRILELSTDIASMYAGHMFAEAGADVIRVELRGQQSDDHHRVHGSSALLQFLNQGKRAVTTAEIDRLIPDAEVLIDGGPVSHIDVESVRAAEPSLVVVSMSPFGRSGPYADIPATEFTVQAESGAIALRGREPRPPLAAGGRIGEYVAGAYVAAAGALGAHQARATGLGDHLDVSMLEVHNLASSLFLDITQRLMGAPLDGDCPRIVETPSIEPTRDGWVGFNTNTRQMFDDFLVMIERPDLIGDEELARREGRMSRLEEWESAVHAWTLRHTTEEIIELATAFRIPAAPVGSGRSILGVDHYQARGVYRPDTTSTHQVPRRPWLLDNMEPPLPRPAPASPVSPTGESFLSSYSPREPAQKLSDLRILDLTAWWAGPSASQAFAFFGADVIHVESTSRLDGIRLAIVPPEHPTYWEMSGIFQSVNTNKRGLTVDLSSDVGRELVLRLIAMSDVVFENYSPRVMDNLGLGWDVVHETNPRAVMTRMPAFGLSGPWRDRTGFAQTMEQASGLAWVTGWPDDRPVIQGGPCDPNAGMHATFATLAVLRRREISGLGALVEVPMIETSLNAAAELVIEYTANGTELGRQGNRSPHAAPHNLYADRDGGYVAIAVVTDDHWEALLAGMGAPARLATERYTTFGGRMSAHDEIDAAMGEWCAEHAAAEIVSLLRPLGVPVGIVWDTRHTASHPQLRHRGFFETVNHPVAGPVELRGLPFRSEQFPTWVRSSAPTLGQHNTEVLGGLLDLQHEQLADLENRGIIGERPRNL